MNLRLQTCSSQHNTLCFSYSHLSCFSNMFIRHTKLLINIQWVIKSFRSTSKCLSNSFSCLHSYFLCCNSDHHLLFLFPLHFLSSHCPSLFLTTLHAAAKVTLFQSEVLGGNADWYSHCGKQYGISSKNGTSF